MRRRAGWPISRRSRSVDMPDCASGTSDRPLLADSEWMQLDWPVRVVAPGRAEEVPAEDCAAVRRPLDALEIRIRTGCNGRN